LAKFRGDFVALPVVDGVVFVTIGPACRAREGARLGTSGLARHGVRFFVEPPIDVHTRNRRSIP
jgi:hypothetical protein